jgi:glc operon protein GlcG
VRGEIFARSECDVYSFLRFFIDLRTAKTYTGSMTTQPSTQIFADLLDEIENLFPEFDREPTDHAICDGNGAALILDAQGNWYGRMFGKDRNQQRETSKVAWQKATQVWCTGIATGEYEEKVYSKQLNWWEFGIPLPELIGWRGGLPAQLSDGTKLALAFSGFRGEIDCEILRKAVQNTPGIEIV